MLDNTYPIQSICNSDLQPHDDEPCFEALNKHIGELEAQLDTLSGEKDDLASTVEALEKQLEEHSCEREKLDSDIETLEEALKDTKDECAELCSSNKELKDLNIDSDNRISALESELADALGGHTEERPGHLIYGQ